MISDERWRNNWLAVSPAGAVRVDLRRSAARRRAAKQTVRDLPAGTPVVLSASSPRAIGRCRAFASEAGIALEREYLAFPSAEAPAYLVEDAPASVGVFVKTVLVTPPGAALATPIEACLSVLRTLSPWRVIRTIAPRVVVGRRT
ncbi:MAG: hypothetical protein ABI948_09880 [Thermoleophilia bacterium]